MKTISKITFLIALAGVSLFPLAAMAQEKIVYIDSYRIRLEYKEFQDAQAQFNKEVDQWNKEVEEGQKGVEAMEDTLQKQALILSEAKKKERQQLIDATKAEWQKKANDIFGPEGRAEKRNAELTKPLLDKINAVLEKLAARSNGIRVLCDNEDLGLRRANYRTENEVGQASKQAAGIAFRGGDIRNSLVQVVGPIPQDMHITGGRHEGVHVITVKGEAAEKLSQAVDLVHYRPRVLEHSNVEVTRTHFLILFFFPFGPKRQFNHLGISGGHDISAHHHRIDTEPLSLVHNERQRADKRPPGQGDLSTRNNERMLWREL